MLAAILSILISRMPVSTKAIKSCKFPSIGKGEPVMTSDKEERCSTGAGLLILRISLFSNAVVKSYRSPRVRSVKGMERAKADDCRYLYIIKIILMIFKKMVKGHWPKKALNDANMANNCWGPKSEKS